MATDNPAAGRIKSASGDPAEVITHFHTMLRTSMQQQDYDARLVITADIVSQVFRPETIARISLGRHWRSLSAMQQSDLTALISQLISATYASRFNRDNGQIFETLGIEALSQDRVRVKTRLTTDRETVSLVYQLQHQDDGWKIYDIVANGVSDLALKRGNYSALFGQGGLEAVTAEIRSSIQEQEPGSQ